MLNANQVPSLLARCRTALSGCFICSARSGRQSQQQPHESDWQAAEGDYQQRKSHVGSQERAHSQQHQSQGVVAW